MNPKQLINSCTITVQELAKMCGVSYNALRKIASGQQKLPQKVETKLKKHKKRVAKIKEIKNALCKKVGVHKNERHDKERS